MMCNRINPPQFILHGFLVASILLLSSCLTIKWEAQVPHQLLQNAATPETEDQYWSYIKMHAPSEESFILVQRLAESAIVKGDYAEAVRIHRVSMSMFPTMEKRFEAVMSILNAPAEAVVLTNLDSAVNSHLDEYCPIPSADGSLLYFTSANREGGYGMEDNYVSEFRNNAWQNAVNMGPPLCTDHNESINSIMADGNRLLIFGNYESSLGHGDIFYSDRTAQGWTPVRHYPKPINSEYFDSDAIMTADGQAMLISSDRPAPDMVGEYHASGTYFSGHYAGNTDIYVILHTDTGWSGPINLGPVINTPFAERTPFLHPDGKTLYFASDGHPSIGRVDVFKSTRLREDSWTEWSVPVNLGKAINTVRNDWGYMITTSGDLAYFSASNREGGKGGEDIYSIRLPASMRPDKVVIVRGTVTGSDGSPLEAVIRWEDLAARKGVGELKSSPRDGTYFIALPTGKMYGYYAEKNGYYAISNYVDLRGKTSAANVQENIVLVSIDELKEKGTSVRINNLFFDFDSFNLRPESFPELNRLAGILKKQQGRKVEISGHTDSKGKAKYNLTLSQKRAKAVVDYLVSAGCDPALLLPKGYGSDKALGSNDTEEGRALNRRVEFRFLK